MTAPETYTGPNLFNTDNTKQSRLGDPDPGDQTNVLLPLFVPGMKGEILLCKFSHFMDHYGPSKDLIKPDDTERCTDTLLDTALLKKTDEGLKWKAFVKPLSARAADENKLFVPLKRIVDTIFKYAGSSRRGNACIMEKSGINAKSLDNGVVPLEFSKIRNVDYQIEVRRRIVGDCHYIMSKDPRRMFIYAIVIEDVRFSMWYLSRSHSVKAISFDWLSERGIRRVIRVFLAIALASPVDLGIDPHVRKARRDKLDVSQQYIYMYPKNAKELAASAESITEIEAAAQALSVSVDIATTRKSSRLLAKTAVAESEKLQAELAEDDNRAAAALEATRFRYFKTVDSIGPPHPYCISTRITRIWKVMEIKSAFNESPITGEVLILKDVWLEQYKPTETDNLASIFRDIENLLANAKEKYAGDDWLTQFMAQDERFASFDQLAKDRLQALLKDQGYKSLFLTKVVAWKGKVSLEVDPRFGRRYAPKQQSRFIYQEVCTHLSGLGTLGNFMDVINQALAALQVLFCAGWVHRDISIGNILVFDGGEGTFQVKLSDLEFAEKLAHDDHRSDPLIGTPYFMPVEIATRTHFLDRGYRHLRKGDVSLAKALNLPVGTPEHERYTRFKRFSDTITSVPPNATPDIPLMRSVPRYNFQHDLESLWWLVLYMISRGISHYPSRDYAKKVFNNSLTVTLERDATIVKSMGGWDEENLHPKLLTGFLETMDFLGGALHEGYLTLEVFGLLKQHDAYSSIHGVFATSFRELLENNEGGWKDLPLIDPSSSNSMKMEEPIIGSKRARDDSDDSSDADMTNNTGNKRVKIEEDDTD